MGKDFLNRTQKALTIKNSSSSRYPTRKKREDRDQNKIFPMHTSNKEHVCMYVSSKKYVKKARQPMLKMTKRLTSFTKMISKTANKRDSSP